MSEVVLDASASSQFISALLLAGSLFDEGVTVVHDGKPLPSLPHIEMTVEALRDAGAAVDDSEANTWRVEPGELLPLDVTVEPDLSNAAPFLAAALVAGGRVSVPDWPGHTTQAGDMIRDVLDQMGEAGGQVRAAGLDRGQCRQRAGQPLLQRRNAFILVNAAGSAVRNGNQTNT